MTTTGRELHVATVTPLREDGAADGPRLAAHGRRLLASGCDGLVLLGTSGEGPSFSAEEREAILDGLLDSGIAAQSVIVATGCAALPDSLRLTRHALSRGCNRILMMPPFFFRQMDDEGLFAAFARVIEGCGDEALSLYLYNIPSMSGATLAYPLIDRLRARYPGTIAGVKDSSADWRYTAGLLERFADLAVYVGHESDLPRAVAAGARGAMSGLGNAFPRLLRMLLDAAGTPEGDDLTRRVEILVETLLRYPLVPAIKALTAEAAGDAGFRAVRPALRALARDERERMLGEFKGVLGDDYLARFCARAA
jgi:4-hydroxy-tetrahydrodipicolinate synthase